MSLDRAAQAIRDRQRAMETSVFSQPPADYVEFVRMQSIWRGLGEALSLLVDEAKREGTDE